MPKTKRKYQRHSAPPPPPKFEPGGEVRTNYVKDAGLKTAVQTVDRFMPVKAAPPVPPSLIPTGKLEIKKEYKLKNGMFAMVEAKMVGTDPAKTPMVVWKKGFTADDHSFKWMPSVQAPERHVEDFIFKNLEEDN